MPDGDAAILSMSLAQRQSLFHPPVRTIQIVAQNLNNISRAFPIPLTALTNTSPVLGKWFNQDVTRHLNRRTYEAEHRSVLMLQNWILDLAILPDADLAKSAPGIRLNDVVGGFAHINHQVDIYRLLSRLKLDRCARKWTTVIRRTIRVQGMTIARLADLCRSIPRLKCYQTVTDNQTVFNDVLFCASQNLTRRYHGMRGYAPLHDPERVAINDGGNSVVGISGSGHGRGGMDRRVGGNEGFKRVVVVGII
ncbi:hypothetical protein K504DRAFT_498926 [Pleomassaria siparia CBS 279.74]|uniref:Uncharacterized protein n=1 Tax=Pleomassaria siparia CBS 279.74 TaxID=1314801 RepID=A0A6G1KNN6_9PLEO|nr:hypothetical protein K504DRAFT_498926 [Pleomassaria siparia CBS 279.74]